VDMTGFPGHRTCLNIRIIRRNESDSWRSDEIVVDAVADTRRGDIHSGIHPVTHTGNFSAVVVIDANGRRIPWPEAAHIEPDELRDLMRQIVTRLYTGNVKAGDFDFLGMLDWAAREDQARDEPELDEVTIRGLSAGGCSDPATASWRSWG